MVDRFRSKPLELPAPGQRVDRADLHFHEVDHSGPTFEARIFIGAKRGLGAAATDDPSYAGSFYVFGHEECLGEEGHCEVPQEVDAYDFRLPHHLEPGLRIVTVTAAVERLVEAERRAAVVDVHALGPHGKPLAALSFARLRLVTYSSYAEPGTTLG